MLIYVRMIDISEEFRVKVKVDVTKLTSVTEMRVYIGELHKPKCDV